jgi:hypothetical protein
MQKLANGECSEPDSARDLLLRRSASALPWPADRQASSRIGVATRRHKLPPYRVRNGHAEKWHATASKTHEDHQLAPRNRA